MLKRIPRVLILLQFSILLHVISHYIYILHIEISHQHFPRYDIFAHINKIKIQEIQRSKAFSIRLDFDELFGETKIT